MSRKTAIVICPGRGTYNKTELGYLARHHADKAETLAEFDAFRDAAGQETLAALDGAATFSMSRHTRGDNASPLIYASSFLDFKDISENIDIVGITGNSMGWYSALALAEGATPADGLRIVNTMGTLMQERMIGGQLIYPFVDENWVSVPGGESRLRDLIEDINARPGHVLGVSIHLGGMLVLAGNEEGLAGFEKAVPALEGRYPLRLPNHAAFHTALQAPVAEAGRAALPLFLFQPARLPLIDGRGAVWWPGGYTPQTLRDYTLNAQVVETYDFTRAITVAARRFAPDLFIITGPGTTLGGAVAQSLISIGWQGLRDRQGFAQRQKDDPLILAMGRDDQRPLVTQPKA